MLQEQIQNAQSERQILQSKIVGLTEELVKEKQQKHWIETQNQKLVNENDDLRNQAGILTRAEVDGILNSKRTEAERCSEPEAEEVQFRDQSEEERPAEDSGSMLRWGDSYEALVKEYFH